MIQKIKKKNSLIFLILVLPLIYSCSSDTNKIEYQEACEFKKLNGKKILICDEEKMNKVKVYTNLHTKKFIICDKFKYKTNIDDKYSNEIGIRCKTEYGYEIIK